MVRHRLFHFALTAIAAAAGATPAAAGCCGCPPPCPPPVQAEALPVPIQAWGRSPMYVVNQGPVYSGPGFYTSPTFEAETFTADYPAVGHYDPFDRGPYDPFRHQLYNPYWPYLPPEHGRFGALHRTATLSSTPRWGAYRSHGYRDPRFHY